MSNQSTIKESTTYSDNKVSIHLPKAAVESFVKAAKENVRGKSTFVQTLGMTFKYLKMFDFYIN